MGRKPVNPEFGVLKGPRKKPQHGDVDYYDEKEFDGYDNAEASPENDPDGDLDDGDNRKRDASGRHQANEGSDRPWPDLSAPNDDQTYRLPDGTLTLKVLEDTRGFMFINLERSNTGARVEKVINGKGAKRKK